MSALASRFESVGVQVLGLSVDSIPCHRAWASGFGGVEFPLLSDFHPRGQVSRDYGVWIEGEGFAERGTFLIAQDGTIEWSEEFECGFRIPTNLFRITQAFAD